MSNSNPGLTYNQVPTAGEWNGYFSTKQDWSTILDTIIAQGGALAPSVPATWTVIDASGASLVFTGVSASWLSYGGLAYASLSLTYPTTANGSNAIIGGLPQNAPNKAYATAPVPVLATGAIYIAAPVINTATIAILSNSTGAAITNATLSGKTLTFALRYPLS
jgi:hypothetical protein